MQIPPSERLLSCSLPCPGIALQDFLAAHDGQARFAWASADGSLELAGAGSAAELFAWGDARFDNISRDARALFADAMQADNSPSMSGPRLFGGFAFRHDFTPDNTWSIYTPAWFVLPHYQLARAQNETWLTINAQIPTDEAPAAMKKALEAALQTKIAQLRDYRPRRDQQQSRLLDIDYPMSLAAWTRMIERARGSIHAGELNKVVLSRAAELRFDGPVQLLPILRYLAKNYSDCYRFLFEPRPRYAFYGASPELLAAVNGRQLRSMALAGSINAAQAQRKTSSWVSACCKAIKTAANSKSSSTESAIASLRWSSRWTSGNCACASCAISSTCTVPSTPG